MAKVFLLLLPLLARIAVADTPRWSTNGPSTGRILSITVSKSEPNVLYLSSGRSVYRSLDSGSTWHRASTLAASQLRVDPNDSTVVYALANGVYKSMDAASSWSLITHQSMRFDDLELNPENGRVLYGAVCTPTGIFSQEGAIFKSSDAGQTWHRVASICEHDLSVDPISPKTLYAGYSWRSDDGGTTWAPTPTYVPGRVVVADPRNPIRRFGAYDVNTLFLVSDDAGLTWREVRPKGMPLSQGSAALTIDPETGRLFFALRERGVYRSGDGGQSWLPLGGVAAREVSGLIPDESSNALTIATIDGLYRSNDFPWDEWTPVEIALDSAETSALIASPPAPQVVYAVTPNRLYQTRDSGRSWILLESDSKGSDQYVVDAAGTLYAIMTAGSSNTLYKRLEGTNEWERISLVPSGEIASQMVTEFVAHPQKPNVLYVGRPGRILYTSDGGVTWEHVSLPVYVGENGGATTRVPYSIAIDPRNSDIYVLGTYLLKSSDRGQTWSVINDRIFGRSGSVAVSPVGPNVVYVTGDGIEGTPVLMRSFDSGVTWETASRELSTKFVLDPRNSHILYAARDDGVFRSDDAGTTWKPLNEGLPSSARRILDLAIDSAGSVLHVSAAGAGVWELSLRSRGRPARRQLR